jgi:hypothetical protein
MIFRSSRTLRVSLVVAALALYGPVTAGEQSRPNILLVVFENVSAHTGAYGSR